jgi:SAM-dependent methyltransferase
MWSGPRSLLRSPAVRVPLARIRYFGRRYRCPVCGATVRGFQPSAGSGRPNDRCPVCGALERHRYLWWYLHARTDVFARTGPAVLHFAPEAALAGRLAAAVGPTYLSADVELGRAMVATDITNLGLPDDRFDLVLCSHILEHVPDDGAAMREMARVTKPGGALLVMVPMLGKTTDEDVSLTDPDERRRRFGQSDHVRYYGRDILCRMERAGLSANFEYARDLMAPADLEQYAIRGQVDVIRATPAAVGFASDASSSPRGGVPPYPQVESPRGQSPVV